MKRVALVRTLKGVVVFLAQHADRPGILRGRVPRQARQLVQGARACGRPHIHGPRCRWTVSVVNSHALKIPPRNGQAGRCVTREPRHADRPPASPAADTPLRGGIPARSRGVPRNVT